MRSTQAMVADLRRDSERGYTLLETLVALVVFGLLVVTLTQGIRLGLQSWGMESRISGAASGIETTDRTLRELISRASPGDKVPPQSSFIGTAHTLSLVTALPDNVSGLGTREADATLLVSNENLELRWRPHYRRWIVPPPAPVSSVILSNVAAIDIAYWQPGSGPQGGAWLSAWSSVSLPPLVRLHLVFPANDLRRWPDIIVAPMQ